jgi:hypothetical protein
MAFMFTEGTKDYIATTPCLAVTFRASGSITAGKIVQFVSGDNSTDVFQPLSGTLSGSAVPVAGLALSTVSDGDTCPVLVWGMAKNLTKVVSTQTSNPGDLLFLSGAGNVCSNSWANANAAISSIACYPIGRVVSGSGTGVVAFISTIK